LLLKRGKGSRRKRIPEGYGRKPGLIKVKRRDWRILSKGASPTRPKSLGLWEEAKSKKGKKDVKNRCVTTSRVELGTDYLKCPSIRNTPEPGGRELL